VRYFCRENSVTSIYVTVKTADGFYGVDNFVIRLFQTLFHEVFGFRVKTQTNLSA